MNDGLPEGWITTSTKELLTYVTSGSRGWAQYYSTDGALFLRISNLDHDTISIDLSERKHVRPPESGEGTRTRVRVGDLLVSITADVGMVGLVQQEIGEAYINQHIALARPVEGINHAYLAWFIASSEGQTQLRELQRGATKVGLGLDDIKAVNVPLPPFEEQRRIVAQIETLFAKVRSSQKRLDKIPAIRGRFRQAVLASASTGRLSADWRARHPPTLRPCEVIMAVQQRRLSAASTVAQRQRIAEVYSCHEEGESTTLPSGWKFVRLSKLADSFDYGTSAKSNPSGAIPVLRMGNIQRGEIDWTDLAFTSDKQEIKDYALQANTVLFNRTNSPELVGKTAIYRGERRAIFAGYLIRVCAVPELDPEYLNLCLNTNYAKEFCHGVKTDGVSQSNINAQKLGAFEVPYCLLDEQREIVRRVKMLFAVADKIEVRYAKATAYVNKLTESILSKAFRGELVPTEAELARSEGRDFETAAQLLDRIKNTQAKPVENHKVKRHAPTSKRSRTKALS